MTFRELSRITNIPYQTLLSWENSTGYRKNLVRFLKESDPKELQKQFSLPREEKQILEDGDIVLVKTSSGEYEVKTYFPTTLMNGEIVAIIEKNGK